MPRLWGTISGSLGSHQGYFFFWSIQARNSSTSERCTARYRRLTIQGCNPSSGLNSTAAAAAAGTEYAIFQSYPLHVCTHSTCLQCHPPTYGVWDVGEQSQASLSHRRSYCASPAHNYSSIRLPLWRLLTPCTQPIFKATQWESGCGRIFLPCKSSFFVPS